MEFEERTRFSENFFVCAMFELRERKNGNLYDLIRCSGLLRQILIDGNNLLPQANKHYRLKFRFKIKDNTEDLRKNHKQYWGSILPTLNTKTTEASIDQFKNCVICIYNEHNYTINDLICYFSHFIGGIHSGKPNGEKEETFAIIHAAFSPFILEWPSHSLKEIIHVTILALEPLVMAIQGRTNMGGL